MGYQTQHTESRRWGRRLGRIALGLLIAVVALVISGAVFQLIMGAVAARKYPAPGEMIAVGEHRLHLYCQGEGSPTVMMEAGHGAPGISFMWVQQELAKQTRVCVYDRAGYGWSETGPGPRDVERTIGELRELVSAAGIETPFVLAGHSLGGAFGLGYSQRFPEDVAGLVLIDARHPDYLNRGVNAEEEMRQGHTIMAVGRVLARVGATHLLIGSMGLLDDMSDDIRPMARAVLTSTRAWDAQAAEATAILDIESQLLSNPGHLGDLPLLVLSAGTRPVEDNWMDLQRDLPTMSLDARYVELAEADHISIILNQEQAGRVAHEIGQLVDRVRPSLAD